MSLRRGLILTSLSGCLAISAPAQTSLAQSSGAAALKAEMASENINAVLLLDNSGSMLDNDPQRLRDAGARLFMQFMKTGDSLGIISFSDATETVRPLSPFLATSIEATSAQIGKIEPIGQYTDIANAVGAAKSMLDSNPSGSGKNVIILLSDGKFDPSPRAGRKEALLDQLVLQILPELHEKKTPVYTLAFSGDADKALLGKIAEITDGVNWFTPSSEKIHESFAELFLSVKKPQVAPASERGFKIDPNIDEVTFYVNRVPEQEVFLESPTGRVFTAKAANPDIRWFQTEKFDVITITKPDAGEWKLSGVSQEDGFATILTNLKLVSTFPSTVSTKKAVLLQAQLYDAKLPVSIPDMADVVKYAFQITATDKVAEPIIRDFLNDSGKDGDEKANDGIFSKRITLEGAGDYRLRLVAKSPTFERQQAIPFRVRPPVVTVEVIGEGEEHGETDDHAAPASGEEEHGSDEHGDASTTKPTDTHGETEDHSGHHDETPPVAKDHADTNIPNKAPPAHSEKRTGPQDVLKSATIQVSVHDSEEFLKNVKVTLTAVDGKKNRFTIPLKAGGGHGEGMSYSASAELLPRDGRYSLTAAMQGTNRGGKSVREESEIVLINRLPNPGEKSEVIEIVAPEQVVHEDFPTMQLLIAILGNILIGGLGFVVLKGLTRKGGSSVSVPPLKPEIETSLLALQKTKEIQTLQIDDARYSEAQGN